MNRLGDEPPAASIPGKRRRISNAGNTADPRAPDPRPGDDGEAPAVNELGPDAHFYNCTTCGSGERKLVLCEGCPRVYHRLHCNAGPCPAGFTYYCPVCQCLGVGWQYKRRAPANVVDIATGVVCASLGIAPPAASLDDSAVSPDGGAAAATCAAEEERLLAPLCAVMLRQAGRSTHGVREVLLRPVFSEAGATAATAAKDVGTAATSLRVVAPLPATQSIAPAAGGEDAEGATRGGTLEKLLKGMFVSCMFLDAPVKATLGRLSEGAAETFGSGNAVIGDHVVSASLLHNRRWRTVEGWATGRMALVQQQQPLEQCDSSVCEKQSSGEEATEWAVQIRRCVAPRDGDASDAAPPASRPNAWAAEPQPPAPEVALGASATLCDAFLPTSEDGNEEFCAVCWDGGDIVCCDHCEGSLHADCDERLRLFGVPEVEDAKVRCGACDLRCRLAIELELQGSRVGAIVARVASAVAASAPRKAPRDAAGVALAAAALAPVLQRWVAARVLWAAATTLDAAGARLCAAFVHLPARHLFPAVFQSELMAPLLVPDGAPAESGSGDGGAARIDASLPAPLSLTAVLDKLQSSVYEDGGRGGGGGAAVAAPAPQPPAVVAAPARKRRVSGAAAAGAFDPAASLTPLFTRGLRLFVAHLATVVGRTLRLSALQPVRLPILAAQLHLVVCAALRAALAQAGAVTFAILALERPGEALERPGEALDPGLVSAAAAGLEAAVAAVEAEVWDWLEAAAAAGAPPRVKVAKEKRILAAPLPKGDDGPTSEQVDGNKATRPSRAAIGSSATEDAAALPVTAVGISSSRPPAVGTLSASAAAAVLRLLQGPPATAVTSGGGRGGAAARQSVRVRLVSASLLKAALAAAVPREGPPAETSSAEPSAHGGLQPEDAGGLAAAAAAAAAGFRQALEADLERRRDALSTHPNDFDWLLAALLRDGGVSLDVARQLALTAKSVGASWPAEGTPAAAGGDVAAVATAAVAAAAASAAAPVTPNATSALDDALMSLLFPESARAILGPHVVPGLGLVTLVPRGSGDMLPVQLQEADVARARTALADPPAATAAGAAAPPACEGTTALMRSLGAFSEEAGSDAGGSAVVAAFRGDPLRCEGCRYGWNHLCAFSSVESALLADGTVLTPLVVEALQARLRAAAAPLAGAPQSRVAAPGDVASGVRAGLALQMEACDVLHQLPGAEGDGVEYPAAIPVLHPVAALARAFLAQQHADESRAGGGRGAGASQALRASARSLSGLEAPYVRAAVLGALATMGHAAITDAIPSAGADDGGGDDVAAAAAAGTAAGVGGSQPRSMRDAAALLARQLQLSTLPLRVAAVVADEVGTAAAAATTAAAVAGPAYPRPAPDAAAMAGSVSGGPVASAPDTEGRDSAPASGGGRMRGLKRRRAAAGAASGEAAQTDAAGRSPFPKGAAGAALRAIASQRRCDELLRLTFSDSLPASHTLAAAAIAGGGLVAAVRASSLLVDDPSRDGRTASASSPAFPDLLDRPVPPAVWPALNLEVTRNALASAAAASAGASSSIAAAATSSIAAAAAEGLSTIAADAAQVVGGRAAAVAGTLEAPLPDPDVTAALPTTLRQGLRMGPGNEDAFFLCWAVEEALRGSDSGGGPRGAAAEPALSQALLYGALREWRRERVAEMARPLPPSAPVIKEAVMAPASAPATAIPPSYAPSARLESYADWRERQGRTRALPSEPDCRGLAAAAPTYLVPELSALDPIRKTAQITDAAPPQLSQHAAAFERCVVAVPRFVPAVVRSQGIRALEARARHNAALLVLGRSRIEGTGVFAADDIAMDDVIAEYTGELVSDAECEAREKRYEAAGIADYMFRLGPNEVIDASVRGCRARYVNHSCDPNCFAVITLPTQHDAAAGVPLLDVDLEIDASSGVAEPVDAVAESSGAGGVENSATGASERPRRSGSTSGRHTGLGGRYWSAAPPRSSGAARRGRLTPGAAMASTGPGSGDEGGGSSPAGATVSGRRVFVYALRPIRRGEELTYDYSFSSAEKPVACRCGAANCRGTLNVQ